MKCMRCDEAHQPEEHCKAEESAQLAGCNCQLTTCSDCKQWHAMQMAEEGRFKMMVKTLSGTITLWARPTATCQEVKCAVSQMTGMKHEAFDLVCSAGQMHEDHTLHGWGVSAGSTLQAVKRSRWGKQVSEAGMNGNHTTDAGLVSVNVNMSSTGAASSVSAIGTGVPLFPVNGNKNHDGNVWTHKQHRVTTSGT